MQQAVVFMELYPRSLLRPVDEGLADLHIQS
jgi:hypothetical protein